MKKEKLSLEHQYLINSKLKKLSVSLSEYSFANLYLFRDIHHYELIQEDELFIRGITRDNTSFLMPLFIPKENDLPLIQSIQKNDEVLFPIPEEWTSIFNPSDYSKSYNEDESDYLFHIAKLSSLAGRHLSKKRNLVKQFTANRTVESKVYTTDCEEEGKQILNTWSKEALDWSINNDQSACLEAFRLLKTLGLNGKIYYVDKEPAGFILGEWINSNCYVVHFEKALKSFKGLYQYILQNFSQSLSNQKGWINLEQDLGIAAIKQAKHSYHPDAPGRKYRIRPNFQK